MKVKINSSKAKKALFLKGMLVKDLARELNISTTYTSNFLNGKCNVSPKLAIKTSELLNIPIEELFKILDKKEM
ncbi:helix-turn-helix transcriptional regulator [Mammaliicoccus sp. I-M35]|uniref:helix-turn-helix transcriptional regulator n=1 Tax=Mammaliicoccus sp. I-M35 TaxID=2898694 RepID=UPI001EFBEBAB|nr:helix-turn-helix transcriptional regulator [Mammaliicoccus sp. I-M35]